MINQFSVKNFKCHEATRYFDLPGLTIVSGTNNSGKSSFLQSIYLLTQHKSNRYPVLLLNDGLSLGSFSNILNKNASNSESIDFSITFAADKLENTPFASVDCFFSYKNPNDYNFLPMYDIEEYPILDFLEVTYFEKNNKNSPQVLEFTLEDQKDDFMYKVNGTSDQGFCRISNLVPEPVVYESTSRKERKVCSFIYEEVRRLLYELSTDNIHYIKALRLNDFINKNISLNTKLGLAGEYTAEVMSKKWNQKIDYYLDGKQLTFGEIFDVWVKRLLGKEYMVKSRQVDRDQYKITVTDTNSKMDFTLDQVGFGISQILPILTLIFSSKRHDVILIENPEVHLHPRLQSLFTDICIEAIRNERKMVIETHSEHIVNRLRLNVKKNPEIRNHVNVYFFEKKNSEVVVTEVHIDESGKIDYWPDNFFDQSYQDLMGLISDE